MLGGAVGYVAHQSFPAHTATAGAYALVGMGALFAGIVRAPMTSVLMIFEMTRDYTVIVPLMIANLASLFISSRLQKQPIYEALAHQDGIHLPLSRGHAEFPQRRVLEIMRTPSDEMLSSEMTLPEALRRARNSSHRTQLISDQGQLVGLLSTARLEAALADDGADRRLNNLLDSLEFPHVHGDHPLHLALERMSAVHADVLPVVSRADVHKLEGIVTLHDVLSSYGVDSLGSA
jgi:CIC family chloride channel protein